MGYDGGTYWRNIAPRKSRVINASSANAIGRTGEGMPFWQNEANEREEMPLGLSSGGASRQVRLASATRGAWSSVRPMA
jgi:hypothetical protein